MEISIPYANISEKIFKEIKTPEPVKTASKSQNPKSSDGKKYVALTFDDGPHKDFTKNLLDTLETKNVKATFYVLGQNVERYPEIMKRIADS